MCENLPAADLQHTELNVQREPIEAVYIRVQRARAIVEKLKTNSLDTSARRPFVFERTQCTRL